jgi:hypothetical protein
MIIWHSEYQGESHVDIQVDNAFSAKRKGTNVAEPSCCCSLLARDAMSHSAWKRGQMILSP